VLRAGECRLEVDALDLQRIASVLGDPLLTVSLQTRVAMSVGILFLMTVEPDLGQSILAVVVATIIGVVSSLPAIRAQRTARSEMEGQP
jgi:hypothetical protein